SPDGFLTILDRLSTKPEDAVFVGDDPRADIAGASAIGMKTIHVQVSGEELPIDRKTGLRMLKDVPQIADLLVPERTAKPIDGGVGLRAPGRAWSLKPGA